MLAASKYIRPGTLELQVEQLEWFTPVLAHPEAAPGRVSRLQSRPFSIDEVDTNGYRYYQVHVTNWKTKADCYNYPIFVNDTDHPAVIELFYSKFMTTVADHSSMIVHTVHGNFHQYSHLDYDDTKAHLGLPASILGRTGVSMYIKKHKTIPQASLRLSNHANYSIRVTNLELGTTQYVAPMQRPILQGSTIKNCETTNHVIETIADSQATSVPREHGDCQRPCQEIYAVPKPKSAALSHTPVTPAVNLSQDTSIKWPKARSRKPKPVPPQPLPGQNMQDSASPSPPLLLVESDKQRSQSPELMPAVSFPVNLSVPPPPAPQLTAPQPTPSLRAVRHSSRSHRNIAPPDDNFAPACYNPVNHQKLPTTLAQLLPNWWFPQSSEVSSTQPPFDCNKDHTVVKDSMPMSEQLHVMQLNAASDRSRGRRKST